MKIPMAELVVVSEVVDIYGGRVGLEVAEDSRLPVSVGPTLDVELPVGYGAEVVAKPMSELVDDSGLEDPVFEGVRMEVNEETKLPVPVGPTLDVKLNIGYGAEDVTKPMSELVDDSELVDAVYGGRGIEVVDESKLPVPVGKYAELELNVGYGAEDDVKSPIAELVVDSELVGAVYGGRVALGAVEESRLPVPVAP